MAAAMGRTCWFRAVLACCSLLKVNQCAAFVAPGSRGLSRGRFFSTAAASAFVAPGGCLAAAGGGASEHDDELQRSSNVQPASTAVPNAGQSLPNTNAADAGAGPARERLTALQEVRTAIKTVEEQIGDVEQEIKAVKQQLPDGSYLGMAGIELRVFLKDLLTKERQLREKEADLRAERKALQAAEDKPAGRFTADRVPADDAKQLFWRHLCNATFDGSVLRLQQGTYFLGDPALGFQLMHRGFWYDEVERQLKAHFDSGGIGMGIIGNPGIGKSVFGYLLMYRWALEGKDVVVRKSGHEGDAPFLYCADGVFELSEQAFKAVVKQQGVMYLIDGINPMVHGRPSVAKTVLVTSPNHDRYHEALKGSGYRRLYMDVWSEEEMRRCRDLLYPHMPDDEVFGPDGRFTRWGGLPRYVFEKVDAGEQQLLESAMKTLKMPTLAAIEEQGIELRESHLAMHLRVNSSACQTDAWLEFGSDYIAGQVTERVLTRERGKLVEFLQPVSLGVVDGLHDVRGQMWEKLAHIMITQGGEFPLRVLHGDALPTHAEYVSHNVTERNGTQCLAIAESKGVYVFSSLPAVAEQPDGVYCKPTSTTLAAVDSLQQPRWLYQMTVNKDKRIINAKGLQKAINTLRLADDMEAVRYIVVVPPALFATFPRLNVTATANFAESAAAELDKRVTQWLITVHLD